LTTFLIMAGALLLLAAGLVAWPLWRSGVGRWTALASSVALIALGVALYWHWSNFNWREAQAQPEVSGAGGPNVDAMLSRLEHRLALHPNDFEGWMMLGRSDLAVNRLDGAVNAYTKAYELSGEQSAQAAAGLGEAMVNQQGGQVTPDADRLFERALQLAPDNPQALFFGAFAAASRGDTATARARWQHLKSQNPPPQIAALIDAQIAALDSPAASPAGSAAASPTASARIHLTIAPKWRDRLRSDAPLFVLARRPGERGGPPLAVKRLTPAAIGTTVELTSRDSPMGGPGFENGSKLELTARLALSGQPLAAPGDLFGRLEYTVGQGEVTLTIDQEVPR
jgi:cytochrome c-type biogenesis protein CcmH